MSRPLRAVIHTRALKHNLQRVRDFAPDSRLMAVVKADGYGHGMVNVARSLQDVDALAVASIDEAMVLQEAVPDCPTICLLEGLFRQSELELAANRGCMIVVHNEQQLRWLEQASPKKPVTVWLKVDTGMNRLGIDTEDFNTVFTRLKNCRSVESLGVMTHFACADDEASEVTAMQLHRFYSLGVPASVDCSAANSAGVVQWPDSHFQWVRPGIMLYGSSPLKNREATALDLQPVMTLSSELVSVRQLRKGQSVGYGASWVAENDTTVGVVACGYGDGYPRHAPTGTPVWVNGSRAPIVGRVSMDLITVDLGRQSDAGIGDPVVLWGEQLPVDEVAAHAGTLSYELLSQVTGRVPREVV